MKRLIIINTLILISASLFSQEEIYFSNLTSDSIHVESIYGLETRISELPYGWVWQLFHLNADFSSAFYVGYFNEKRISNTWTLNSSIGLQNIIFKSVIWQKDSIGNIWGSGNNMKTNYALMLEAGIEPRWYFEYKQRYKTGKSQLNSGFYLSFPFVFQTTILNTPEPLLEQGWLPKNFSGAFVFCPTLGFRQSVSKKIYLETNLGFGADLYINQNKKFEIVPPNLYPYFNFKAAYTFK